MQDHIKNLGEDPSEFLGYNPLSDAFEIHLKASHSHLDTLKAIDAQLSTLAYVDDVIYHAASVETLNSNLNKVSFFTKGSYLKWQGKRYPVGDKVILAIYLQKHEFAPEEFSDQALNALIEKLCNTLGENCRYSN